MLIVQWIFQSFNLHLDHVQSENWTSPFIAYKHQNVNNKHQREKKGRQRNMPKKLLRYTTFESIVVIFSILFIDHTNIYGLFSLFYISPFPHIDAFWCPCSRQLFENIGTKEEIAQNKQFLLLPQCFPLLVVGYPFNYKDFLFFDKSRLLQNCRMRGRVNVFIFKF